MKFRLEVDDFNTHKTTYSLGAAAWRDLGDVHQLMTLFWCMLLQRGNYVYQISRIISILEEPPASAADGI